MTSKSNDKIGFYAQARKGDFFVCCFHNTNNSNVQFLYKIESNVETFCKFVFCEFDNVKESQAKDKTFFSVFLPSEKENILNVFNLEFYNKATNCEKEFEDIKEDKKQKSFAVLDNEYFDLLTNCKLNFFLF